MIRVSHQPWCSRVEYSGELDVQSAKKLAVAAALLPPALRLVIDISRATPVHDRALGVLLDAMPRGCSLSVRCATRHHERLVGSLGCDIEDGLRDQDAAPLDD